MITFKSFLTLNESTVNPAMAHDRQVGAFDALLQRYLKGSLDKDKKDELINAMRPVYQAYEPQLKKNEKELKRLLQKESRKFKDVKIMTRIKPFKSVVSKVIERKRIEGFKTLGDLVGGAVLFKTKEDADAFVKKTRRRYAKNVVGYEEKKRGSDTKYGYYGSHHLDLNLNGIIVEVQVMTRKLWNYKTAAHDIYDKYRDKDEGPDKFDKYTSKKLMTLGNRGGYVREGISYESFITEAQKKAGKMELLNVDLETARSYAQQVMGDKFALRIKNFDSSFLLGQQKAKQGRFQRKDMPRLKQDDIEALFDKLHQDGIRVKKGKIAAKHLIPAQRQFYFDHSIEILNKKTTKHVADTYLFISKDNTLIDGHHRFLSALLIDPEMKLKVIQIDMPVNQLLPYAVKFGDDRGNLRNL